MAARLPIAGVLKVEQTYQFAGGAQMANILHYSYVHSGGGLPSQSDVDGLAGSYATEWEAVMMPKVNGDITYTGTKITPLDNSGTNVGFHTSSAAGGKTGQTVPASAAVIASYGIGTRWRGGRPKTYYPAMGGQQLDTPSAWHQSDIDDYLAGLDTVSAYVDGLTVGSTAIGQQGCVSYVWTTDVDGVPTPGEIRDPPVFFPFTSLTLRLDIGSQRRRIRSTSP